MRMHGAILRAFLKISWMHHFFPLQLSKDLTYKLGMGSGCLFEAVLINALIEMVFPFPGTP